MVRGKKMPQELVLPIIPTTTETEAILRTKILNGKVNRVILKEIMITGIDAGQVGNVWSLRMGDNWVMEDMNVVRTTTNAGSLDNGQHTYSYSRDVGVFIHTAPTTYINYSLPTYLTYNKVLNSASEQIIAPKLILGTNGSTSPTFTSAWVKLELWTVEDIIRTSNMDFLQRQWRN